MNSSDIATSPRFLPEVEAKLREAGWHPDRLVEEHIMDEWFAIPFDYPPMAGYHLMFPAAYRFIREFGGLTLGPRVDSGIRATLIPSEVDVDIDDMLGYEWVLESRLFPIGFFQHTAYYYLMIDLNGQVWAMVEGLELIGKDTEEAVTNLITGGRPKIRIDVNEASNDHKWSLSSRVEDAIRAHQKRDAR